VKRRDFRYATIDWKVDRIVQAWRIRSPDGHSLVIPDADMSPSMIMLRAVAQALYKKPNSKLQQNVEAAYVAYLHEYSLADIGEAYGVTAQYVGRVFKDFGLIKRPTGRIPCSTIKA
jgi:hypothetical protein